MLFLRMFTQKCDCCGLINTYKVSAVNTENAGQQHKFHTEGGYSYEQKSKGQIFATTDAGPGLLDVEITTTHYVPKTTVYDGLFQKKRITTSYKCAVCGNVIKAIKTTETKIGD